jgi:predicted O-methyltransferase YrrM
LRKKLLHTHREISITDLGAGSKIHSGSRRKISDIAKNSAKSPRFGRLFFRMVRYFKPTNIVEIGTSLGLSTAYFAMADSNLKVYTLEGCPQTRMESIRNFEELGIENAESILGNFSETLEPTLKKLGKVDFVFFDGNHQHQATLDYFETCLKYHHEKSVFIFDDIHWSEEMTQAWNSIQNHEKTVVCLDLFFIGIVFFDPRLSPQNFKIRF